MSTSNELIAILERILAGSRDEAEIAKLQQWLKVSGSTLQFVSQDGKFNTNIGQVQGGEIQIGDRIYSFDVEALQELLQPTAPLPNVDWQAVSQGMLEEQLRLTTNPLTSGEGITYRTEQVYVPLGLVERKKQTRRREDVSPEQGSELYRETEITQTFEHQQFLEQVLRQKQSPKSQGRRIAIIGEPGAGKTTLLQQIAQWVSGEMGQSVVIWVSLADLRSRELESYLLEVWLQAVVRKVGQAEASIQVQDDFVAQFNQGLVWLLLDGVDEMQATVGNPLGEMERQIRTGTMLQQARIVLSCRLNLWDGGSNALDSFDNYRTLEFFYPQQVEQFIGNWFGSLPSAETQTGQRLCATLRESGKERIRDLVKNPLRLTLLCFNWYLGEGKLPETKAGLYEQFVADFYEWKKGLFATTGEQRRRLNAALGELAREAIDKEATRFRLRQEFMCEYLGEPDDADSLFGLALRLGWLNKVGVDGNNPRKGVYAFFHPTFQEYFAAKDFCNRADWEGLVRHIFEEHWQQIFLLVLSLLPQADSFLQLMKKQIDNFILEDRKLQKFLTWAYQKELSVDVPYKSAAVRAYYLALNEDYRFNPYLMYGSGISLLYLACSIDTSLFNNLEFDINLHLACTLGNAYALTYGPDRNFADLLVCHFDEALSIIDAYISGKFSGIFDFEFSQLSGGLRYNSLTSMHSLKKLLQNLKNQIPKYEENSEIFIYWCHTSSYSWAEQLRETMIEYRDIGYDWNLQERQKKQLKQYYDANKLLVNCLNSGCNLSLKMKKEIEETLLLPMSEIKAQIS